MNVLSTIGGVLGTLGVLVAFGDVLGRAWRRTGRPATDDPWDGNTLEWRADDASLVAVTSSTPLLDAGTTA
jgi:heme/copper-type cytochrome/quinol oxidase subunit 1